MDEELNLSSIESHGDRRYRNEIATLDLSSGRIAYLRPKGEKETESTFIRGIRPSPSSNYVVVLLKEQCALPPQMKGLIR